MSIDFCEKEEGIHRGIHAVMHLIEDHAKRNGIPIRFAASKILEGDKKILEQLQLTENEPGNFGAYRKADGGRDRAGPSSGYRANAFPVYRECLPGDGSKAQGKQGTGSEQKN